MELPFLRYRGSYEDITDKMLDVKKNNFSIDFYEHSLAVDNADAIRQSGHVCQD